MPNEKTDDGKIYDPVDVDAYPENADVTYEPDQTTGFVVYEDPDHHRSGNMTTVPASIDLATGTVQAGVSAPETPYRRSQGRTGADPGTPEAATEPTEGT